MTYVTLIRDGRHIELAADRSLEPIVAGAAITFQAPAVKTIEVRGLTQSARSV